MSNDFIEQQIDWSKLDTLTGWLPGFDTKQHIVDITTTSQQCWKDSDCCSKEIQPA